MPSVDVKNDQSSPVSMWRPSILTFDSMAFFFSRGTCWRMLRCQREGIHLESVQRVVSGGINEDLKGAGLWLKLTPTSASYNGQAEKCPQVQVTPTRGNFITPSYKLVNFYLMCVKYANVCAKITTYIFVSGRGDARVFMDETTNKYILPRRSSLKPFACPAGVY